MTWTDESLRDFGWNIQKLINGDDLTRRESYEMFSQVLGGTQPDLQQGAFLAALVGKGETAAEIAGAWQAIYELDTEKAQGDFGPVLVENSGTGMDKLNTFNVSTAAAVVAAAGGVKLARHGARALTSSCGTVDLLEAVGVDVECEVPVAAASIEKVGIGLFNGMSPKVHPRALGRILSQIRFGSTLNIAASLASPCRPTHALRGVYNEDMVSKAAEVMKEIGYERAMVVHGFDEAGNHGMDELSIIGESAVLEFDSGRDNRYKMAPEDIGAKRATYEEIQAMGDVNRESIRFLSVLAGRGYDSCREFTCLNAGAIFYVAGRATDMKSGLEMARETIGNGRAFEKMAQWVVAQADENGYGKTRFNAVAKAAGLEKEASALM